MDGARRVSGGGSDDGCEGGLVEFDFGSTCALQHAACRHRRGRLCSPPTSASIAAVAAHRRAQMEESVPRTPSVMHESSCCYTCAATLPAVWLSARPPEDKRRRDRELILGAI